MGMGVLIGFENPMGMGMGMGMGMTFENGYGCGYSYTRTEPAPRPSLLATPRKRHMLNSNRGVNSVHRTLFESLTYANIGPSTDH